MARAPAPRLLFWSFSAMIYLYAEGTRCFSWGGVGRADRTKSSTVIMDGQQSPSLAFDPKLPRMYEVALNELQELESEPLCHRVAARLLVNNCQLLDGQDEATIMKDTGRAARDFVDSYAASLAICDLERGSFAIPIACSKFREATLIAISPPSKPQLHVTTAEVDSCLEGLAQSDSAWNTWVSYRHKALRFCEAAHADNEKDQNIRLHQRLTKILARLTSQLEEEMEARFRSLNRMFQDAGTAVGSLKPQVGHLRDKITELEALLNDRISRDAQQSATFINNGLDDARCLQELLTTLVETTRRQSDELAISHDSALQVATDKVSNEIGLVMTTLAAAVVSSTSLQKEIESSQLRAAQVFLRQERVEKGMKRLEGLADALLIQHEGHQERLDHAQQSASNLLDVLDSATSSAATLRSSIYSGFGWTAWWPHIFCPATSLIVGSYGLPPSTTRNFLLLSLGEIAGLTVSHAKRYSEDSFAAFVHGLSNTSDAKVDPTTRIYETIYSNSDLSKNGEEWQSRFAATTDVY